MDNKLLEALFAKHPKPWSAGWTCSDNGNFYDTIEDAKGNKLIDPKAGFISDEVHEFLLALGDAEKPQP